MNRFFKGKIVRGFAAVLGFAVLAAGEVSAATVTPGFDPVATLTGAVRYRNFSSGGGKEIWVGVPMGSPATLSSDNETTYSTGDTPWGASNCVQITYSSGNLTTKVANAGSPCSFASPLVVVTKTSLTLGTLNYLEVRITKNSPTNSVALNGVVLTPAGGLAGSLGNFAVTNPASPNPQIHGTFKWKVTDIALTSGFTLEGTIALNGLSGGGDSSYVEVAVGSVPPSDTDGPVTSNVDVTPKPVLLNGLATVTALVDDSTTGVHPIQAAYYSLNGGADAAMTAQDGALNAVSEAVKATFTGTDLGPNEVCVYGVDSLNNPGDPTCQNFLVTYDFDGFYSPIAADLEAVNVAKAGQAIPAKWRLTDANGVPISEPASFVRLASYPVSCTDFAGDILDSVEEYASGSSGLQYNGDGYWQFNWKTPKDYANTCRAMYVEFNSGATSPVVKFQFKK